MRHARTHIHTAWRACVSFIMLVCVVINEFELNLWQQSSSQHSREQRNSISLMNERILLFLVLSRCSLFIHFYTMNKFVCVCVNVNGTGMRCAFRARFCDAVKTFRYTHITEF